MQNRIQLVVCRLIFGTQLVHHEFTDLEVQPTARAMWSPADDTDVWAGVSRPVRTPSLEERTLSANSATVGNPNFQSEEALIYELGARRQFCESVGVDLALFYNVYDDLALNDPDPNTGQAILTNDASGDAYGAELAVDFVPTERWSVRSSYAYFRGDLERADGSGLVTGNLSPKHSFSLRSYYDLAEDWELDLGLYVVEGLGQILDTANYDRMDARIGWRPTDELRLSVGAQGFNAATRSEFDEFDNARRQFFFEVEYRP